MALKRKKLTRYITILMVVVFAGVIYYSFKSSLKTECIDGDCTNGFGTLQFSDGRKYVGSFQQGDFSGMGTLTLPDGRMYEGEWRDDLPNGKGIQTNPDGTRYEGEWKDGQYHGEGTLVLPSGGRFSGGWFEDKPHGNGTYVHPDGRSYVGQYSKGVNEHGVLTLPDGTEKVIDSL